jgi:Zn-dependent metalloprotease
MNRLRSVRAGLCAAALAAVAPALALKPGADVAKDRTRFGFDHPTPLMRKGHLASASQAFSAYNASQGRSWKMRFSPRTGLPSSLTGGADTPRLGTPSQIALSFINSHSDMLALDPTTLSYERQTQGSGHGSVLFRQSYKGLSVEFAAVKVHIGANGSVIGVHSSYEPIANLPTVPLVTAAAAGTTALADAGGGSVVGTPQLVVLPSETDGLAHLAWKLTVRAKTGVWRYYVDALGGAVLLRFQTHQYACAGGTTCGNVTGQVFDVDPTTTAAVSNRAFDDQFVYVGGVPTAATTFNDTSGGNGDGYYSAPTVGPVAMSLQGPFVSVSEFRAASAHYDNGPGQWGLCNTPVSVTPYAFNTVYTATLDVNACTAVPAATPVSLMPLFSSFNVGVWNDTLFSGSEGGSLDQDDQVITSYPGAGGARVGGWVGARGAFNGSEAHGQQMQVKLSALGGSGIGYTIGVSSTLFFTSPAAPGALSQSHLWIGSDTFVAGTPGVTCTIGLPCPNLHGEESLFYHLNLMHDFYANGSAGQFPLAAGTQGQAFYSPGVNAGCPGGVCAPINGPVLALAHAGPDLLNAFYDPDFDDIFFGDGQATQPSDAFADDATVPHHEYTHFVVNKIWPLVNFGQAGTISEANADYFSASSLNDPNIGSYINQVYGAGAVYTPLRALNCVSNPPCYVLSGTATPTWSGEIHADSPFVSQAIWEIRETMGQQCADNLQFQALLFFPESFEELYDALFKVASLPGVTTFGCSSSAAAVSAVQSAFSHHIPGAVSPTGEDAYEPNDSFDTATDISTLSVVSATIYPIGDQDYYTFGSGAGLVQATLKLPPAAPFGQATYYGYQLRLFDNGHNLVASAAPPYNGIGTFDGQCQVPQSPPFSGCTTTSPQVTLSYNNPAGGQLYLEVVGGTFSNSPTDVNSTVPYTLSVSYPHGNVFPAGIVTAQFSNDTISFSVNVTTYVTTQLYNLAYVQLLDQGQNVMPNTNTSILGGYLNLNTQTNAHGQITGNVQLAPGFAARFPSVGTIYLQVFGYDVLGSTVSLGVSNAINLTGTGAGSLTAYNNVFNPLKGQYATVKYQTAGSGRLTISLYTVVGERIVTLFDGEVPEGMGSLNWNGRNAAGNVVASGVYIVRAQGPGIDDTQKIVVIK